MILIHTSVKLVTIEHSAGLPCLKILIHTSVLSEAMVILIHTSVKLVTCLPNPAVHSAHILIHTSVKLVTAAEFLPYSERAILIHTSVKLVTNRALTHIPNYKF